MLSLSRCARGVRPRRAGETQFLSRLLSLLWEGRRRQEVPVLEVHRQYDQDVRRRTYKERGIVRGSKCILYFVCGFHQVGRRGPVVTKEGFTKTLS